MKFFFLALVVLLPACGAFHKPPPGWPDGDERPINARPVEQNQSN